MTIKPHTEIYRGLFACYNVQCNLCSYTIETGGVDVRVAEQFEAFYDRELTKSISLPFRITSRYSIDACLASSETKEIYLLTSRESKDNVILRRLPLDRGETNHAEYDLLCSLDHPDIPKAIELFEEGGFSYFIRSYMPGGSLYQWIAARGVASEREAVDIIVQLCDILTYLHTRQPAVVHRDIKPQNVILDPNGTVFLIDFDISRKFDPAAVKDTVFMGTSATAPPEQYGYGQTDARSDLYSLGILLIFLCTGRYERTALPDMPPSLRKIAETCTQFAPKDRYASALQIKRALLARKRVWPKRIAAGAAVLCAIAGAFWIGRATAADRSYPDSSAQAESSPVTAQEAEATSVSEDGTVRFASDVIEGLVREKLGKTAEEPVTVSELETITEFSVVGVPSENISLPVDFIDGQAYRGGELITRGKIQTLTDLSLMKGLETLVLVWQQLDDLSLIAELHLTSLTIIGNYVSDLSPLADMETLRNLDISYNPIEDLSPLESLQRLETLHIEQCNVTDLSALERLTGLTVVNAAYIPCSDYSPLLTLPLLRSVEITGSSALDVAEVSGNQSIEELIAINCGLAGLGDLQVMPNLEQLELSENEISDLSGIERYQSLKRLILQNNPVDDLSPLAALPALEELDLRGVAVDLSPLLSISTLEKVICSSDMQSRIGQIKEDAAFEIEIAD